MHTAFLARDVIRVLGPLFAILLATPSAATRPADSTPGVLTTATDLQTDSQAAKAIGVPLILVVTRRDCAYCMRLKREVLIPMRRGGVFANRAIVRELMIEPDYDLRDLSGAPVGAGSLAERYEATFVPTVLILDPSGQEAATRLIGINNAEMYGHYLDEAIVEATANIRASYGAGARRR